MGKYESTAINDLIHVTQGRMPEFGGPEPADGLFVTAPPPPASFVPVAAYFDPCALTTPVPLVSAPPPPLPRRRAPNATPPVVPILHDDEDDDDETQIDEHVMAKFAAARKSLPFASPITPQPILPHYAIPSPVPLPPAPHVASHDATERMPYVSFGASPAMPSPLPFPMVPAPTPIAPPSAPASDTLQTHRVAPLSASPFEAPPQRGEFLATLKKVALPFGP